ncbi:MAG TPA: hypothetical protein PLQ36_03390, partial [Candidatus Gracilibacteria bacterium]|nr:hypothetical protein [Candidatus Gracilibacteria bacterium]
RTITVDRGIKKNGSAFEYNAAYVDFHNISSQIRIEVPAKYAEGTLCIGSSSKPNNIIKNSEGELGVEINNYSISAKFGSDEEGKICDNTNGASIIINGKNILPYRVD